MLSRTAQGLFWMSRYIERAENVARLLDAGRRIEALPGSPDERNTEWSSIVIASGAQATFPHPLEEADQQTVAHHLIFDRANPSSILSCMEAARENARAMRIAITGEVWVVLNTSWSEMRMMTPDAIQGGHFAGFLEWVKTRGAQFRGAMDASMLRGDGYHFIELGKCIERADATARLLDVKYNVLLPDASEVGRALDTMQWQQILRAANSLRAYRSVYHRSVTPVGVVDFLVLNHLSPRSLLRCAMEMVEAVECIGAILPKQSQVLIRTQRLLDEMRELSVEEIMNHGLHEWLTETIVETNMIAGSISAAYGFDRPVELAESA